MEPLALNELIKPADWPEERNWGPLTIDASCTPADITYPRDLMLLNEVRTTTERIIDNLCAQSSGFRQRPRCDRGLARAHFLRVAKQKRSRRRKVKAAIKHQLGYLRQNLKAVDALIAWGASLLALKRHWWQKLLASSALERQQSLLLTSQTNSIWERLLNLVQTHVRPIVRGKARAEAEFGCLNQRFCSKRLSVFTSH
jgi:hypothetical protein